MKNPLKENNHSNAWIIPIAITALTAGFIIWFAATRENTEEHNENDNHPGRFKNKMKRKSKTDLHELHHLVPGSHEEH